MNILIIGKDTQLLWPQHVKDACDNLGHKNKLFLFNNLGIADTVRSFAKKISPALSEKFVARQLKKSLEKFKPDVVILISAFFIPESLYEAVLDYKKALIIGWSGDGFDKTVESKAQACNKLYCTDSFFVERALSYDWAQTSYLPLAFNEKIFYKLPNNIRNNEIVFIGNPDKNRTNIVDNIKTPLSLVGPKWNLPNNTVHSVIKKSISINEVARLYHNSFGVLNIKQESNVVNGLNMRSFEAPACGALLIHDNVKDLKRHYISSEEVVVYDSISNLNDILSEIYIDTKKYEKIARQGQERCLSEHTYTHRQKNIL